MKQRTIAKVESKGAKKGTVTIATFEEIPIAYIPGDQKRILIKAVGDADPDDIKAKAQKWSPDKTEIENVKDEYEFDLSNDDSKQNTNDNAKKVPTEKKEEESKSNSSDGYKRNLSEDGKIWTLSCRDIDYLSLGCGVVGTGGGGSTRPFDILCKQYLNAGNKVQIVKSNVLDPECNVICVGFMGAPAMLAEKLMNGAELLGVVEQMKEHLKLTKDDKIALICGEIGGCNGLIPIIAAAQFAEKNDGQTIDLVDADYMGRAFPELQMITPSIHGKSIAPISCQDEYGAKAILADADDNKDAEMKMRIKCVELGMKIAVSLCPLKGKEVEKYAVLNSYEFAWKIGKIIYEAKEKNINPLLELQKSEDELIKNSKIVYYGKIIQLMRENDEGFNRGTVKLQRINDRDCYGDNEHNKYINAKHIYIDIQNENYLIRTEKETLITVPDLICMFDDDNRPIATEELRYGLRATVMIFPAHSCLKSEAALKIVGPEAFGYENTKYIPIENFKI